MDNRNTLAMVATVSLALLFLFSSVNASYVSLVAGNITLIRISADMNTSRWGGIVGTATQTGDDSVNSIMTINLMSGYVYDFPNLKGSNLITNDREYYYAVLPVNVQINTSDIENTTETDLEENQLFDPSHYPQFYPGYYNYSDNPQKTFCQDGCHYTNISIGGIWFKGIYTMLDIGVPEILLKYKVNSSLTVPMYLVPISQYTAYNHSPANMEFILPALESGSLYYLYILSKAPSYNLTVWIDGVQTLDIPQTALTYNVTAVARNIYTGSIAPNVTVALFEENGADIFLPYKLSGYISQGIAMANTDSNGRVTFILAPTEYGDIANYTVGVGIYQSRDNTIVKRKYFNLEDYNTILFESKELSGGLGNNAKVIVNAMNQIVNSLYVWASKLEEAHEYILYYNTDTGEYYFIKDNGITHLSNITLQTGVPNVISVVMENNAGQITNGLVSVKESDGYLIMNPTYNPLETGYKTHEARLRYIPTSTQFVICPTSYGNVHSKIEIDLYDENKNLLKNITVGINPTLDTSGGGIPYSSNALKTEINKMVQVLYSLYYSLNY